MKLYETAANGRRIKNRPLGGRERPANALADKTHEAFSKGIMKVKIGTLSKITAIAFLFGGAFCWSATAGDVTGIWNMNCAACHGKDGKGQTMMGRKLGIKDLTDSKVQDALTDDQAVKDIKEGVTDNGQTKMKAFGGKLSDDEIKALVAHIRSLKSGQ
jgi:cytochrome c553